MSYSDFGLPCSWEEVEWLLDNSPKVVENESTTVFIYKKKVPSIPTLPDYQKRPTSQFWDNFPFSPLPSYPTASVNTNLLKSLLHELSSSLPPVIIPWGKKAILSLSQGAQAYQLSNLPSLQSHNSSSVYESGEQVTDTLGHWLQSGILSGPFAYRPLIDFRCNTMNCIKKKNKIRLVMDLSSPKGSCYNENIRPFIHRKVSMSTARDFSYSLLESGADAVMSKIDWVDAFKNIPICSNDLRLQGFSWLGRYFVEKFLVFGSKNSVAEYDNLAELVLGLACVMSKFPRNLVHRTLDDVPVVSPKITGLTENFTRTYKNLCKDLNINIAPDCPSNSKAFSNQTEGLVLGFRFNSSNLTWSFPDEKAKALISQISIFLSKPCSKLKYVQEIVGSLEHFSTMMPFAKAFRHPLYYFIRQFKEDLNIFLPIPKAVRSDLRFWWNLIERSRFGLPISPRPYLSPISSIRFTSDAAGVNLTLSASEATGTSFGVASIGHDDSNDKCWQISRLYWPLHFIFNAKDGSGTRLAAKSSTLEAVGLLLPFLSNPSFLSGKHVILYVDNSSLIYGWKKRSIKNDLEASILVRSLHILSTFIRCKVYVEHVPRLSTSVAILADHLSRSSTTSVKEEKQACLLACHPRSPVLSSWLHNPQPSWNLPLLFLNELKDKLRSGS